MVVDAEILKLFALVLVRFTGLILTAPILGSNNFPIVGKIGLVGLSAMLVTPTLAALDTPIPAGPLEFGIMAIGDLLIGMILGLVMTLMFAAIQIGGQVMDMQAGFGLMNVFNPAFETQFPIYGFFFFILAVLYLLVSGGHILMIRALASTFESIPPGGLALGSENLHGLMGMMSTWGTAMFYDGFLIAAPVAAAMNSADTILVNVDQPSPSSGAYSTLMSMHSSSDHAMNGRMVVSPSLVRIADPRGESSTFFLGLSLYSSLSLIR